ncbi:MAG: hypothetical protein K8W52_20775, partial [Deltaproteobacteria bacterium]|nr:hypothetical protein [Deltaproteobacteria bacterium]
MITLQRLAAAVITPRASVAVTVLATVAATAAAGGRAARWRAGTALGRAGVAGTGAGAGTVAA